MIDKRTSRLQIPVNNSELEKINELAKSVGMTTTSYVRFILLNAKPNISIE